MYFIEKINYKSNEFYKYEFYKKIIKMNFIDKMFTRILVTAFGKKSAKLTL